MNDIIRNLINNGCSTDGTGASAQNPFASTLNTLTSRSNLLKNIVDTIAGKLGLHEIYSIRNTTRLFEEGLSAGMGNNLDFERRFQTGNLDYSDINIINQELLYNYGTTIDMNTLDKLSHSQTCLINPQNQQMFENTWTDITTNRINTLSNQLYVPVNTQLSEKNDLSSNLEKELDPDPESVREKLIYNFKRAIRFSKKLYKKKLEEKEKDLIFDVLEDPNVNLYNYKEYLKKKYNTLRYYSTLKDLDRVHNIIELVLEENILQKSAISGNIKDFSKKINEYKSKHNYDPEKLLYIFKGIINETDYLHLDIVLYILNYFNDLYLNNYKDFDFFYYISQLYYYSNHYYNKFELFEEYLKDLIKDNNKKMLSKIFVNLDKEQQKDFIKRFMSVSVNNSRLFSKKIKKNNKKRRSKKLTK